MPIRAQLFDGTVLEFPDNTDPGVIQSTAKRMTSEIRSRMPDASPAPKEGMGAAIMGGLKGLGSRLRTGVEAIVSPEEAALRGLERGEAIRREYAPGASLQRVKDVYAERGIFPAAGEAISQIPTAIAEQAPNIAATIASAKIGAMGGTAIAPGIGTVIGGVGGALVPSLTQLFGSNVERQAEVQRERGEPIDISRGKALAAAVPGAALEAASTFVPLGRAMVGKLLGPQGAKLLERGSTEATEALAKESLLKVVGKGAAIGAGVEIPTEVTQQMLERLQAGLPVTSEDALTEYGEAMYGAGLVGGPFGAVGRVGQRSLARQKIAQEPPPEIAPEAATPTKPAAQYFDEPSPLENPYGNITADLMPDVAKEINAARAKRKQTSLDSFSIEDAVNAGLPQERVDSILVNSLQRAGIAPDLQIAPEDIYDTARIAGVNTEQPGFPDFLRRATGSDNPEQMSPVQRVAAIGAIQSLPEGVGDLPTGTNARSFTEAQYKAGLKAIKATPAGGVTRDELLANIQKSGVKNVQDAMSVLQTAIRDGNVEGVAAPAYAVADASGNIIGRYDDQQQAQDSADRLNGSVTEFAQTRYFPSEQAAKPVEPKAPVLPEMQALQQQLAPVLRRFGLEDVGLKVVKSLGQEGADGAYANRLIQVAMGAENPMGVMRHESIHALKELGAFKQREWRALEKKAQTEWIDKFIRQPGLYDRYQDVYQQQTGSLAGFDEYIAEEAIAEAFKYFDQTKPPVGLIGNLFNRLRNFFASLRNAMQGAGFQTAEDVLGRIEEGKVRRQREAPAAAPKFSIARETEITRGADEIAAMDADVRDDTSPSDMPGGYEAYSYYEARKLQPKPSTKLKRVTENNSHVLWESADYIANVDGELFSVTKQEDPDDPDNDDAFVYAFARLSDPFKDRRMIETIVSTPEELFDEIRDFMGDDLASLDKENKRWSLRSKANPEKQGDVNKFYDMTSDDSLESALGEPINPAILDEEEAWQGGIADLGDRDAGYRVQQHRGSMPYQGELANAMMNAFGAKNVTLYRVMTKDQFDGLVSGEIINEDIPMAFTFNPDFANRFRSVIANYVEEETGKRPDLKKDFVLAEMQVTPESIVMRGKPEEQEVVMSSSGIDQRSIKVIDKAEEPTAAPKFSMAKETDEQFFLREQLKPKARQVIFEIAPNPDDADLSAEWNSLPEERRQEISRKLKNTMTKKVLDVMGARGRIADQVGSYENDTNASFALFLEKGNALEVAKGLGFAFSQKSMMVVSPNKARGMSKMGAVTLEIGDKNFGQIQDIYNTLRKIDLNGQSPVNGQTTANGRMTILNDPEWTGVETDELADIVDAALGYKYNVFTDDVYAAFPEAKDYDYASKENDPADEAGDIRERLRSVRDEASEAIRQEIRSKVGSRDGRGRDKGRGNTPLAGAPLVAGATGPDPRIVAVAEKYAKDNGIPLERQSIYVDVDPDFSKSIAQAYDEMPHAPNDPAVKEAYQDLIRQTTAQYKALEDAGYKFYFYDETNDPYDGNPWNAMRELRAKKTMGVFATEAGFGSGATELNVDDNPLLAETGIEWPYGSLDGQKKRVLANDLFRAVHDAFGHGIEGAGFRAVGEENAWQAHAKLFKGPALGALTSETRGQNSWLNYGKYGEKNQTAKVQDTVFADQKTGLMPEWTWQERVAPSGGIKPVTTETIVIDGVIRPTRNSEGRLIFPTEEGLSNFWKWFGDSAIVDNKGRPVVMYHGTARDIEEFIPKQADAIFVTPNPSFAEGFGPASEDYMVRSLFNKTTAEERYEILMTAAKAAYADKRINRNEFNRIAREYRELDSTYGFIPSSIEDDVYAEVLNRLPSRSNILSLYVSSKNPFDFKNPDHVEAIVEAANMAGNEIDPKSIKDIKLGRWAEIEGDVVQNAIRNAGFDGFYVREGGETNLAVYDSSQLKSAIGNVGTFSPEKKGIKFSLAQTNTPEFKRWFGDSKVVDAEGKPLVVYHGTSKDKDFTSFNVGMRGAWFTSSPEEASMYSKENDSQGYKYEGGKFIAKNTASRVMPVYLSIQNPYDLTKDDLEKLKGGSNYAAAQKDIFTKARLQGFDGIDLGDGIWVVLKSPNQIKSAIGNRGTFDLTKKDIRYSIAGGKAFALDPTTSKDNFIYLLQDDKIDLKRVNDGIYKTGKKIGVRWNAYEKEETYYGKAAERIKQFATRELHQVTNKMQSAGISLPEMDDYLLARHAPEANAYLRTINPDPNQNAGMSDAEAAAYMQSIPASKRVALERIAKDVDAMTKGTRDLMVEYGLESKKTIDQWDKTYKHYVPLFREETEGKPLSAGRGFSIRGDTSKRRTGSTRKVVNVLANIALQREQVIARGERNRVGNSLYGMVLLYPNPDFWSVIRPEKMTKDQIRAELFKLGIDPATVDEMAERPVQKVIDKKTGIVTYKVPPFWKDNPNLLFTRVNGEERIIAFNKNDERAMRLVTALRGMDAQKQAEVIKSMGTAGDYFRKALDFTGKTTRYFAAINTQYNPAFGIYNLMRDIGGATINLQTTPLKGMERKVVADAFVALKDVYKDLRRARDGLPPKSKWGQIFDDFGLQGGKSGFSELFRDSQERSDALQAELKKFNEGKLKGKGRAIMEWLSDFNDAIENAIRVSVYKNALDKGLSKQKAASLGKNITVNFNRKGSMSKHIQTLYAFFNAAVQGTARIAQTLMMPDGKLSTFGKRVVVGGITLGMMQAVLLAMAGIDEDELPDYIKDKSIVIPYGDGKYVSIPLPLGYHVIPAFGRRVMEFAMSDDKNVGKAMIGTAMMIADGFNPFGSATFLQTLSPTITDPLVALAENKDFNSKPIAIEDVSSMSPTPGYTRSSQNALAITKGIAYGINILSGGTEFKPGDISPTADQIEYLVGQLTGGVGREVMKIGRGAESIVTGEELATYNIPIIGRLIGNTQQKAAQRTRFYDNIKTMNGHQAEIEGRLKSNQDVTEYLKKYPEAAMYQEADKIYRKISALRSEKEYMKEAGESREAIKRIDDMILELMAGFNELQSRYSKEIKATQ